MISPLFSIGAMAPLPDFEGDKRWYAIDLFLILLAL